MKIWRKRNFLISGIFAVLFFAAIYPYNHDMYIPGIFTALCALLNLGSAVLFAVLLYLALEKRFPREEMGGFVLYLLIFGAGHGLFAMMNRGSWVCLGLTAAALAALWHSWRKAHPEPKNPKRKWYCLTAAVVLACVLMFLCSPELRVKTFVALHGEKLQQRIEALPDLKEGEEYRILEGMPGNMGFSRMEIREEEHLVVEFQILARGLVPASTYYGCYYSAENVPAAYEKGRPLTQDGHDYWAWQGEGDNHGVTWKIRDHWYYFEASF